MTPALARVIRKKRTRTRLHEVPRPFERAATDARRHRAIAEHLRALVCYVLAPQSGATPGG